MDEGVLKVDWHTHRSIRRHPANPLLTAAHLPYPSTLVFNAGVCRFGGQYVMIFRNDIGDRAGGIHTTQLGIARSQDGIAWTPDPQPLNADPAHPLHGAYDPRLTVVDGRLYLCFARGVFHQGSYRGTVGGIAVTDDLETWEVLHTTLPDNRNMVLFPERIDGKLVRLDRPFAAYMRPGDPFDIWLSTSSDGREWGGHRLVLTTQDVPWVNDKIGPGTPPIRTDRGWLSLIHCVDRDPSRRWGWSGDWTKRYSASLMLLDLDEPWRVVGLSGPVLVPERDVRYEASGYRDYVVFPGGLVAEENNALSICYGSADTVECLATTTVTELLSLLRPPGGAR